MSHVVEKLPELIAGELDNRTALEVRSHAERCAECGAELAAMQRAWDHLAPAPPPPAVQAALLTKLHDERARPTLWEWLVTILSTGVRVPAPALAALGAALAVSLWMNVRAPAAPQLLVAERADLGPRPAALVARAPARVRPAITAVDVSGQTLASLTAY